MNKNDRPLHMRKVTVSPQEKYNNALVMHHIPNIWYIVTFQQETVAKHKL